MACLNIRCVASIDKDLASQFGNIQMRIMRVPEMMCPKNGTNMIGFLPESDKNSQLSPDPSFTDSESVFTRERSKI